MLKHIDPDILTITNAFMYTEYPHKSFWSTRLGDEDFRSALLELLSEKPDTPLMLYVHMPYCAKLCWFCTCHMIISRKYDDIESYLQLLYSEIALLKTFFEKHALTPRFSEVHLGGGSPTLLNVADFDALTEKLSSLLEIERLDEFSIEIDPRHTTKSRLLYYHKKGINRISIGVQDFDPKVQKAINRPQPFRMTKELLDTDTRSLFPNGINFDIICGLPHQTEKSIKNTAEACVQLSPDRICLNYLHLAPEFAKHQKLMSDGKQGRPEKLPDYYTRKLLFVAAMKTLVKGGYVRTGFDHFAKPTDAVAQAMQRGEMHWNALGVTAGRYTNIIGIGIHSYSTLYESYFQNHYTITDYEKALKKGRFPVFRGHHLSLDDLIRRDVIQTLRNFFSLDIQSIDAKYNIKFKEYFSAELNDLENFVTDGLVQIEDDAIKITEKGHQFANTVCFIFDAYKKSRPRF